MSRPGRIGLERTYTPRMGNAGRRRPTRLVREVVVVWGLAVLPQVLRVAGHGPAGQTAAAMFAVVGAVMAASLVVPGLDRAARVVAFVVPASLGLWMTGPLVGRVPWCTGVLAALVVAAAVTAPAPTAVAVSLVPAVVWVVTGQLAATLVLLAVVGVLVLLSVRTGVVASSDAAVAQAARRADRLLSGRGSAVRRWWTNEFGGPARWAAAVGSLLALPVMVRLVEGPEVLVRGTNDYSQHVERAVAITLSPFFMSVPHPGWHVAFRLVDPFVGPDAAVVVLGMLAAGATVAVLVTVGRSAWDDLPPLGPRLAAAYGLAFLLLDNVAQLLPRGDRWWNRLDVVGLKARGSSYYPMHQWGSPTMTLSLPLVLLMVATLMFSLRRDHERARRHRVALGLLTVAASVTLPAATLALVPAVTAYVVATRRWDRRTLSVVVPWFLVPGSLVCLLQTGFLVSAVSSYEYTSFRWQPFWIVRYIGLDRPAFWLLLLVVPAAWWSAGRRYLRDPWVVVSLLSLVVSLGPAVLLQQTAPYKMLDGDLAMPAWFAGVLVTVASVRWMLVALQDAWAARRSTPLPPSAVASGLLLSLMVCSGVLDLLTAWGAVPEF